MDTTVGEALTVRLLGELDLRLGDVPLPPLESARAESLLAYLLIHRGAPQPRQRLAFLLWPDSTEQQARTNLRHVLHKLRRALPDADRAFALVRDGALEETTDVVHAVTGREPHDIDAFARDVFAPAAAAHEQQVRPVFG